MRLLASEQKDKMGEFWNQIIEICDKTELYSPEVAFILRRIAFTIDCYCEGEAKARKKENGNNVEEVGIRK